jgi:hypothetical protein
MLSIHGTGTGPQARSLRTPKKRPRGKGRERRLQSPEPNDTLSFLPLAMFRCQFFFFSKFYYAKRRFSITSKYQHMHEVLNVDEIKN